MRNLTIKQRLKALKRRYSKVSTNKFFYNHKRELKRKHRAIYTWFLIQDNERGYSIFPFTVQRKIPFTIAEWVKLFRKPYGGYQPIYDILTQAVLPAINARSGSAWRFVSLIGWAGKLDAIPKTKNTDRNRKRNKTTKKRNADARSSDRR